MVEQFHGKEEVIGSTPIVSTILWGFLTFIIKMIHKTSLIFGWISVYNKDFNKQL